ncbi:MAM domain-containing glycosylphosphatidylinositol anchor protein 1 [Papilio machaon]|uniref:MAM domain-containing glycosylphosphatidylinositol anchor protein 1 n=1 Tax=Papilio machaon TaxID=76193 RepID=A0A0N1PI80_PAPMA|nr:MAM domain-containing glycosylphosphatidylinositol anchor protein 1 [Papilio machaon]
MYITKIWFYALSSLLSLNSSEKQKYILFEKWGNQGNTWYDAVLPLVDFSDNFQIVIEGIRGSSFTSDIAVDDVAILQGKNCTAAQLDATTPSVLLSDSCVGRCDLLGTQKTGNGCSCTASCFAEETCCVDFFDTCIFSNDGDTNNDDNASNTTEIAPQTQKLIASSSETTSTTITTTTTTTPRTTSTERTTTTTSTTTTTAKPTTAKPTTAKPTTTKPTTTSTTSTTTTTKPNVTKVVDTGVVNKTNPINKSSTTQQSTTTTILPTTTVKTTSAKVQIDYSYTPIQDVFQDEVKKETNDEKIGEKEQHTIVYAKEPTKSGLKTSLISLLAILCCIGLVWLVLEVRSSRGRRTLARIRESGSLKTSLISLLAILCCIGLVWLVLEVRSSRGRRTLARIRGHITSDPEVRYLSTDVDDD